MQIVVSVVKPYVSDDSIAADFAALAGLAWRPHWIFSLVFGCPIPSQDREPSRSGNRVCRSGQGSLKLQARERAFCGGLRWTTTKLPNSSSGW